MSFQEMPRPQLKRGHTLKGVNYMDVILEFNRWDEERLPRKLARWKDRKIEEMEVGYRIFEIDCVVLIWAISG